MKVFLDTNIRLTGGQTPCEQEGTFKPTLGLFWVTENIYPKP